MRELYRDAILTRGLILRNLLCQLDFQHQTFRAPQERLISFSKETLQRLANTRNASFFILVIAVNFLLYQI